MLYCTKCYALISLFIGRVGCNWEMDRSSIAVLISLDRSACTRWCGCTPLSSSFIIRIIFFPFEYAGATFALPKSWHMHLPLAPRHLHCIATWCMYFSPLFYFGVGTFYVNLLPLSRQYNSRDLERRPLTVTFAETTCMPENEVNTWGHRTQDALNPPGRQT